MKVWGEFLSVEKEWEGSAASADVAAGETVVPIVNADEFRDSGGICLIGDVDEGTVNSYTYELDPVALTLTVDPPLVDPVESGDPIYSRSDTALEESQVYLHVQIDDDGEPVRAPARADLRAQALDPDLLVGTEVELESTEDGYEVVSILFEQPSIDPANVATPVAVGRLTSAVAIPDATETRITGWSLSSSPGWGAASDVFIVPKDGRYLVTIGTRWGANSTGQRACWFRTHSEAGIGEQYRDLRAAASFGGVSTQATGVVSLLEGEGVEFRAYQTSGAALSILSGDAATGFSIVWIGDI